MKSLNPGRSLPVDLPYSFSASKQVAKNKTKHTLHEFKGLPGSQRDLLVEVSHAETMRKISDEKDSYGAFTKQGLELRKSLFGKDDPKSRATDRLTGRATRVHLVAKKINLGDFTSRSTAVSAGGKQQPPASVFNKVGFDSVGKEMTRNSSHSVLQQLNKPHFMSQKPSQNISPLTGSHYGLGGGTTARESFPKPKVGFISNDYAPNPVKAPSSMSNRSSRVGDRNQTSLKDLNEEALRSFEVAENWGFNSVKSDAEQKARVQRNNLNDMLDELCERSIQQKNQAKFRQQQTRISRKRSEDSLGALSQRGDDNLQSLQHEKTSHSRSQSTAVRSPVKNKYMMYEVNLKRRSFIGNVDELGTVHQQKVQEIMNERSKQMKFMIQGTKRQTYRNSGAVSRKSSIKSIAIRPGQPVRTSVMMDSFKSKIRTSQGLNKSSQEDTELSSEAEVNKALKKFRKATAMKQRMESMEQNLTGSQRSQSPAQNEREVLNSARKNERGMSHQEYITLKENLKKKLKRLVPITVESLDYRIRDIEHRLTSNAVKEQLAEQDEEIVMRKELDPVRKEEARKFLNQKKALEAYSNYSSKHELFQNYSAQRLIQKNMLRDGLLADCDQYRARVEAAKLLDLGTSIEEKYGQERSWQLSLRKNFKMQRLSDQNKLKAEDVNNRYRDLKAQNVRATSRNSCFRQLKNMQASDDVVDCEIQSKTGLASLTKDNRMSQVEIIRKTAYSPIPELTNFQKEQLTMHYSKRKKEVAADSLSTSQLLMHRNIQNQDYLDDHEKQLYLHRHSQRAQSVNKLQKEVHPDLDQGHTLNTLTDSVMKKYASRPDKLHLHLPFQYRFSLKNEGIDPNLEELMESGVTEAEPVDKIKEAQQKKVKDSVKPEEDPNKTQTSINKNSEIYRKQIQQPKYREGDIMALHLVGKNKFDLEKEAAHNLARPHFKKDQSEATLLKISHQESDISLDVRNILGGGIQSSQSNRKSQHVSMSTHHGPQKQLVWMQNHILNDDLEGEEF